MKKMVLDCLYGIYKKGFLSRYIILLMDVVMALISAFVSTLLTKYFLSVGRLHDGVAILVMALLIVLCTLVFSYIFKTHLQVFRHASSRINRNVVFFVLSISLTIVLLGSLVFPALGITVHTKSLLLFGVLFMTIFFSMFVLSRAFIIAVARWIRNNKEPIQRQKKRVLIFDVRESSVSAAKLLEQSDEYIVLGYCTRGDNKNDYQIDGMPIYQVTNRKQLAALARDRALQGIIFPAKQDFLRERESFIFTCESLGLRTYLMPGISESSPTKVATESVQRVQIEDLLLREQIRHNNEDVIKMYQDKVVLVTGAAGSIGSELVKQVAALGVKKLVILDNAETPLHNIRLFLEKNYPDLDLAPVIGDGRFKYQVQFT